MNREVTIEQRTIVLNSPLPREADAENAQHANTCLLLQAIQQRFSPIGKAGQAFRNAWRREIKRKDNPITATYLDWVIDTAARIEAWIDAVESIPNSFHLDGKAMRHLFGTSYAEMPTNMSALGRITFGDNEKALTLLSKIPAKIAEKGFDETVREIAPPEDGVRRIQPSIVEAA